MVSVIEKVSLALLLTAKVKVTIQVSFGCCGSVPGRDKVVEFRQMVGAGICTLVCCIWCRDVKRILYCDHLISEFNPHPRQLKISLFQFLF
jgi:hypothetical protein